MEMIKTIVKAIVVSYPGRLTVEQLKRDYLQFEGRPLPTLDYDSCEQMLRSPSFADVVQVYGTAPNTFIVAVQNAKSQHITKLINEQKPVRKRHPNPPRPPRFQNAKYGGQFSAERKQNHYQNRSTYRKSPGNTRNYYYRSKKNLTTMSSVKEEEPYMCHNKTFNEWGTKKNEYTNNWVKYNGFYSPRENIKNHHNPKHWNAGAKPKNNNVNFLNNQDSRLQALETIRTFQEEIAENRKKQEEEAKSKVHKDSPKLDDVKQEDFDFDFDFDLTAIKFKEIERDFSQLNLTDTSVVDDTTKDCNDDVNDEASTNSSTDIFYKPKKNKYNEGSEVAIPDYAYDSRIFMFDFPKFTVKFGDKIKPFEMPKDITVDSVIQIYISEVHNPYRFWFHLNREHSELDELMYNIEQFYKPISDTPEYSLLPEQIQVGQLCVTVFNGYWHRAEIVQAYLNENTVKVFFMDYGTVSDVDISMIKYMRVEFAELPACAYRGCLAQISPIGLHWNTAASLAFLSMSSNRLLHAQVSEIDEKNRAYYMMLCDTHEEETVRIDLKLISENHALMSSEWLRSARHKKPRLRHKREDYPTFDMFEKGEYPTLTELIDMESKGNLYENTTDKLIYNPRILNFEKDTSELLRDLPFYLLSNNPFANDIIKELGELKSKNTDNTH